MNPLNNFTHTFVIFHTLFPKMKLIGNFSMEYLSIFFTYLKICNSWNHSNPSQHTSVLQLPNLRWKRSLSQVTIHPLLIKQIQLRSVRWEIVHAHLLNCHSLLPHLLLISTHICLASLLVVTWIHSLNLHPRIPLILWIVLSCVLPF